MAASSNVFRSFRHMFAGLPEYFRKSRHVPVGVLCCSLVRHVTHRDHSELPPSIDQPSATSVDQVSATSPGLEQYHTTTANMEHLKQKFGWMAGHVPCFGVNGDRIHVLKEPIEFYETLKHMVRHAKSRIVLASLYLGTGELEAELVNSILEACKTARDNNNKDFEVHILLDYNRGSRGGNTSSRTMLLPLLEEFSDCVHIHLYHTPDLRGLLKKWVPAKYNETIGLTHLKIYLADDDFVISGANLGDSYFTNRQDRYIKFAACPQVADYFSVLVKSVCEISFRLQPDNSTSFPPDQPHPYEDPDDGSMFKAFARKHIQTSLRKCRGNIHIAPTVHPMTHFSTDKTSDLELNNGHVCSNERTETVAESDADTWLFPLIQMGPFDITYDEQITKSLLQRTQSGDRVLLASGYFNLTKEYVDIIVNEAESDFEILTASPEANGFYRGSGVVGYVPDIYTHIARQFQAQVCRHGQESRISLSEYYRHHWTFHGKGLWYYLPDSVLPVLTLIGSPNFGYRSVYRDLECQVAMVTSNHQLQSELRQEHERLYASSSPISEKTFDQPDRYVKLLPRLATNLIKHFF